MARASTGRQLLVAGVAAIAIVGGVRVLGSAFEGSGELGPEGELFPPAGSTPPPQEAGDYFLTPPVHPNDHSNGEPIFGYKRIGLTDTVIVKCLPKTIGRTVIDIRDDQGDYDEVEAITAEQKVGFGQLGVSAISLAGKLTGNNKPSLNPKKLAPGVMFEERDAPDNVAAAVIYNPNKNATLAVQVTNVVDETGARKVRVHATCGVGLPINESVSANPDAAHLVVNPVSN